MYGIRRSAIKCRSNGTKPCLRCTRLAAPCQWRFSAAQSQTVRYACPHSDRRTVDCCAEIADLGRHRRSTE
jgi:hypothetical protein